MEKQKINLVVTATRTDQPDQFKGENTFTNDKGQSVLINYICTNPKDYQKELDFEFFDANEKFTVKGSHLVSNLFEKFSDRQRLLSLFSMDLILFTIEQFEGLSSENTQKIREMGADVSTERDTSFYVNEIAFNLIFK